MGPQCRGVLGLGAALALITAALHFAPWWGPAVGLDDWDLPGLAARLQEEQRRQQELEVQLLASRGQAAARARVGDDLAAGRLTLREAAAALCALNEDPDFPREQFRAAFPGASDEERCCRAALAWARQRSQGRPGEDEVLRRLEEELQEALGNRGQHAAPSPPGPPSAGPDGPVNRPLPE
jgi:hypothetical protein